MTAEQNKIQILLFSPSHWNILHIVGRWIAGENKFSHPKQRAQSVMDSHITEFRLPFLPIKLTLWGMPLCISLINVLTVLLKLMSSIKKLNI